MAIIHLGMDEHKESSTMVENWRQERDVAVLAAKSAGKVLLDWQGRFTISKKGANDVVTEADHAAQETIFRTIERRFPSDGFIGEENGGARPEARRRWIVDPLDGTSNYVHGIPLFAVSIGLEVDGELVVGVVHDPVRNECFSAGKGLGAELNGSRIQSSSIVSLEDALICGGMPSDVAAHRESVTAFVGLAMKSLAVRRLGSAALALAYVASGRAEVFFSHDVKPWDVAGGVVLIRESGGLVTHLQNEPYSLRRGDILATNGLTHADMVQSIMASVRTPYNGS
jgi:myo-inositol-1(or 4)-monophosphatase